MSFLNTTKHHIKDMFKYNAYNDHDTDYETYWKSRDTKNFNEYQRARAKFLYSMIGPEDSVLDMGCGAGSTLGYLRDQGLRGKYMGVDISDAALNAAKERGVETIKGDIHNPDILNNIGVYDYVTAFEVLEHMPDSEKLLTWMLDHARKGVLFSMPNTGFFVHRFRLLFGRFPLQWRAHPSEHVRFWTLRDMRWWLDQLGHKNAKIHGYLGVPVLYKIWPSLFAAGQVIFISKDERA
jgi:methionine biosynthesis protein MetW